MKQPKPSPFQVAKVILMVAYHNLLMCLLISLALLAHLLWVTYRYIKSWLCCHRSVNLKVDWSDRFDVPSSSSLPTYRVCVIGAGFSGLGLSIKLKQAGMTDDDVIVLERGHGIGGTWRDNQYPGCACDIPSTLYSFSFEPNADWDYQYARQPEIRSYLERCADKYQVRSWIQFGYSLVGADWDESRSQWRIKAVRTPYYADGKESVPPDGRPAVIELYATFLAQCAGGLSDPQPPSVPGLSTFKGAVFHSARWRHDVDLTGKRVAVVGSGASAIQIVPELQRKVKSLILFQRTPSWVVPRLDFKFSDLRKWLYRNIPFTQNFMRAIIYWRGEAMGLYMLYRSRLMWALPPLVQVGLHMSVADPDLRKKLTPSFALGCKRVLVSNDWYPAITSPNVTNVFAELQSATATSVIGSDKSEHEVDVIIFATGFQVQPQDKLANAVPVVGKNQASLAEASCSADQFYLGTTATNLPNLFVFTGPNTGLANNSMVYMIECQLEYVIKFLTHMHRNRKRVFEVKKEAARAWNMQLLRDLPRTVHSSGGCRSWYLSKEGRNTTLFPYSTFFYRFMMENVKFQDYHLF